MGLRSDHQSGTTWGEKGKTPIVRKSGNRFSCNMLSAISNRGKMFFMVFPERFTAPVFISFLERLVKQREGRTIFLIIDRHRVHTSKAVANWLERQNVGEEKIRLFYLPAYSPDYNPDEYLNQDFKQSANRNDVPTNQEHLRKNTEKYRHSLQSNPQKVANFFKHPKVRYAS